MKAAVYYETGTPEVFRYEDVPDPEPKPNQVLVQIEFISMEGGDTLSRFAGPSPSGPYVVGYQAAGQVIGFGERVTEFSVGDRVVTTAPYGSHAEKRVAPQRTTWRVPDGLDLELAVCVPIAFGTAHDCLFEFGALQEGQSVLIHAGAGALGWRPSKWQSRRAPKFSQQLRAISGSSGYDRTDWTRESTTSPRTSLQK
jgi:NADPH2:quinone reductase